MTTNECWLGMHETCTVPEHCECLCHVEQAFAELLEFLMKGEDKDDKE